MNKKKQITIYDISEEAGVSIATVSRVLNDSPRSAERQKSECWTLYRHPDMNRMRLPEGLELVQ